MHENKSEKQDFFRLKRLSACPMLKKKKRQPRNDLMRRRNKAPFTLKQVSRNNIWTYSTLNQLLRCLFV